MNRPAAAPYVGKLTDLLFGIYRDHIPGRNKDAFHALFDAAPIPSAHPADDRDTNPDPQWVLDTQDACDALVDPYHPLTDEARKARGAIRLAALKERDRQMRERARQQGGEMPL